MKPQATNDSLVWGADSNGSTSPPKGNVTKLQATNGSLVWDDSSNGSTSPPQDNVTKLQATNGSLVWDDDANGSTSPPQGNLMKLQATNGALPWGCGDDANGFTSPPQGNEMKLQATNGSLPWGCGDDANGFTSPPQGIDLANGSTSPPQEEFANDGNSPAAVNDPSSVFRNRAVFEDSVDEEDRMMSTDELLALPQEELAYMYVDLFQKMKLYKQKMKRYEQALPRTCTNYRTLYHPDQPAGSFESTTGSVYSDLGHGGFGTVCSATGSLDKKKRAIKTIRLKSNDEIGFNEQFDHALYETRIHASLPPHKNLVEYVTVVVRCDPPTDPVSLGADYMISMEMCNGGDLKAFLSNSDERDDDRLKTLLAIFAGCVEGLLVLHKEHILHRDIKPANIFLVQTKGGGLYPKIGDFGLSHKIGDEHTPRPGWTKFFSSPEQVLGAPQDESSDVYSLGTVLLALALDSSYPFELGRALKKTTENLVKSCAFGKVSEQLTGELFGLVKEMTSVSPERRPGLCGVQRRAMALVEGFGAHFSERSDRGSTSNSSD